MEDRETASAARDKMLMGLLANDGDVEAFRELVERWDRRVFAFLVKGCGNADDALDLRQEVFLRVYRYGGTYDADYAFSTWLFRIATNVLRTWQAKQRRCPATASIETARASAERIPDGRIGPRITTERTETLTRVWQRIELLPPEDRELLLLRLQQEFSYREIGQLRGQPESTVKSQFYAVLARLRTALAEPERPIGSVDA